MTHLQERGVPLPATMKAAVLVAPERFEVREVPLPVLGHDDVLVKVKRCGLCGTDMHIYHGKYSADRLPLIPFIGSAPIDRENGFLARPGDEVDLTPAADGPCRLQPRLLDDLSRRHRRWRPIRDGPSAFFVDANRHRFVALPVEMREYCGGRGERHLMLPRSPTIEHADAKTFHGGKDTGARS